MTSTSDYQALSFLVVDDDDLMRRQVELVLNQLGIEQVTLLADGQSALHKIIQEETYDVLILDLNMPSIDGIEVIRHLAEAEYDGAIALFSGEDARILKAAESLANAHNLYVLGSLSKPVTADAIESLLNQFKPRDDITRRGSIEKVSPGELADAIARRQIQPFYQPKVRATDKSIASVEVLARWIGDDGGMIPPIAFIPVAEEHDLIDDLTIIVVEHAFEQLGKWRAQGYEFSLGVNISADSLDNVDFPEKLGDIATRNSVPCSSIVLEITESRLMQNLTTSLDVLTRLRLKGFGLSIDDFGTGYSSMDQLKTIPFTELKIDRSFVHGIIDDPAAFAILESSADLAKKLNLTIVAEGVEDQADWDVVVKVGCDLIQGYFIAKPMSGGEFERWVLDWERGNT